MTHSEKIEYIRQAAIKANPDILKLEFGCDFQYDKGDTYGRARVLDTNDLMVNAYVFRASFEVQKRNITKVIGRKIGLADLLMTIRNCKLFSKTEIDWGAVNSIIIHCDSLEDDSNGFCAYDLLHDDLNLQTPEFVNWFYELIK